MAHGGTYAQTLKMIPYITVQLLRILGSTPVTFNYLTRPAPPTPTSIRRVGTVGVPVTRITGRGIYSSVRPMSVIMLSLAVLVVERKRLDLTIVMVF